MQISVHFDQTATVSFPPCFQKYSQWPQTPEEETYSNTNKKNKFHSKNPANNNIIWHNKYTVSINIPSTKTTISGRKITSTNNTQIKFAKSDNKLEDTLKLSEISSGESKCLTPKG